MSATRDSGYHDMIHGLTVYPGKKGDHLFYKFIIEPSMVIKWTNNRFEAEGVPGLVSVAPFPQDSEDWDKSFVPVPGLFSLKAKGVLKANERPNDFMAFMQHEKLDVSRTGSDEVLKCTLSSHYMYPVPKKKAKVDVSDGDAKIDMNNDPFIGFLLAGAGFGSLDEARECYDKVTK
jgi:hypothetical protein